MKLKQLLIFLLVCCITTLFAGCTSTLEKQDDKDKQSTDTIYDRIMNATFLYPADNDLFFYDVYDNYVTITSFIGKDVKHVKIPDTLDGKPVYVINEFAFEDADIETLEISKNVYSIKHNAFYKCSSLKSVKFTDVKQVPEGTLKGDGLIKLREGAFMGCSSLEEITLPNTIDTIEESAFEDCSSLTKITIPSLITELEDSLFSGCKSLTEIHIGETVTKINDSAFKDISPDAKMYGPSKSAAAKYASDNFIFFVVIED